MFGNKLDDAFYFIVPLNGDTDFGFFAGGDDNDFFVPVAKDDNNIHLAPKDNHITVLPSRARTADAAG